MKKYVFFIFLTMSICSYAQELQTQSIPISKPFKGFHLGVTGQVEVVEKIAFTSFSKSEFAPIPRQTFGWEAGLEFSYHFAHYYGVSVGLNVGTIRSYLFEYYMRGSKIWDNGIDDYVCIPDNYKLDFLVPVQFEFHYPLKHNFYFTASVGMKLKGLLYCYKKEYNYSHEHVISAVTDKQDDAIDIFEMGYEKDLAKLEVDFLSSVGVYYRLPYADLLRLTIGANVSLNNSISGYYKYFDPLSSGTFTINNNFLYFQLSYIHTFDFKSIKKQAKKNNLSFSSKKERNKYLLNLLKSQQE